MEEILDDDGNVIGYEGGGDGADGGSISLEPLQATNPYGSVQPINSGPDTVDETHDKRGKSFFHIKDRYFYTHQFEFDIVIHAAAKTRKIKKKKSKR